MSSDSNPADDPPLISDSLANSRLQNIAFRHASPSELASRDNRSMPRSQNQTGGLQIYENVAAPNNVIPSDMSPTEGLDSFDTSAVLQRLKEAVNAKMLKNEQNATTPPPPPPPPSRVLSAGIKRIASIREEAFKESPNPDLSPTLNAAFESPLQTASTESTESVKTVKGSAALTPAASALRTPSYPFPYVPGTPRPWNSSLHKPFTALSPTIASEGTRDSDTIRSSGPSTPVPNSGSFMPPAFAPSETSQEYAISTPNLYDLVLMLNLEPGITSWWTTVTHMFHEFYGVDRMSLSLPADAGELSNVPWGQKASYSQHGMPAINQIKLTEKEALPSRNSFSKSCSGEIKGHEHPTKSRLRKPHLVARHSYAGYEPTQPTPGSMQASTPHRPVAARTRSYAPQPSKITETTPEPTLVSHKTLERLYSISDTDFSSETLEKPRGPYSDVFHALRALDHESEALLESGSVNKIIERGKLVVLTRDFSSHASNRKSATEGGKVENTEKSRISESRQTTRHDIPKISYEEYEQMPSSPWAQSPAPSPAIQADPEENPFFSHANVDEASFKPPEVGPDYLQKGAIETIGIDQASTVIHIPLIHPRYPSNFPFRLSSRFGTPMGNPMETSREGRLSPLKKAPIAILSLSVPLVPFPPNLTQSLQLLAPHLATTYDMAQQYSSLHHQLDYKRARNNFTDTALGDIVDTEIDVSNDSLSLTSPSDYSGRSRLSPGGSVGTPGWEHGVSGFNHHLVSGTPGQSSVADMVDSYFDAKIRVSQPGQTPLSQIQHRAVESPGRDEKHHRKVQIEDTASVRRGAPKSPFPDTSNYKRPHSLLHSYGADFISTFQTLPAATAPSAPPSKLPDAGGIVASVEQPEMPPPSERLLRTIVDSLPVQIFTACPGSGVISWVNSKFLVYRGQEAAQIISDPWKAIHLEDRTHYLEEWQRSLSTGHQFSHKVRLRRFDGSYRWFYVRATPLKDKRQKIVHWAGTYMDIHEQHVAETNAARQQETAASEAKYRALANSSPQIVFAVTRSRGIVFCNSQWLTYSGQTEEQASGMGFMDYIHPDDLSKCRLPGLTADGYFEGDIPTTVPTTDIVSPLARPNYESEDSLASSDTVTSPAADSPVGDTSSMPQASLYKLATRGIIKLSRDQDGRPSYSTEVRLRSKEGQYRWHLVRVLLSEPIRKDGSEEETWYGTCTDINDHKILEQTLKDTMDAKSRFLSNMSHEIRTPLNGILGMVNILIDSKLSSEQMEHVNIISNSTEGLRDLINDILDLSKVEAGMITLNMEWMHVRSLIEEVNDIMFALSVDKGLELNYRVAPNVPSMVKGDRFRIRQVLLNVVGNAIKFTQSGEVFVKCELFKASTDVLQENELCLQFQVMDTGKGFTEKEAEFLFKRFSQIDSTGVKTGTGTGLGLAISMQLVELHGGKMMASSQPGKGSTFTFTVKCTVPSVKDRPSTTATSSIESMVPTHAAMIPTPLPVNENSQGMRFPRTASQEPVPPSDSSSTVGPPSVIPRHPSTASSGSSEPSLRTVVSSIRSERSSISSAEFASLGRTPPPEVPAHITDQLPTASPTGGLKTTSDESVQTVRDSVSQSASEAVISRTQPAIPDTGLYQPPALFLILVICPLVHTREAITNHIELTLPKLSPSHITERNSFDDSRELLSGDKAVTFSHLVIDLPVMSEVIVLLDHLLEFRMLTKTCAIIVTDVKQRREINSLAKHLNFEQLAKQRRVLFIFKPLKPSKLAVIFDPQKTSEISSDKNQNTPQSTAINQTMIFDDTKARLGNKGLKLLLIEDNKTSQMVLSRFLKRVGVEVEIVDNGAEGTNLFFDRVELVAAGAGKMWDLIFVSLLSLIVTVWKLTVLRSVIYICLSRMVMKPAKTFADGNAKIDIHTYPSSRYQPTSWVTFTRNALKPVSTRMLPSQSTLESYGGSCSSSSILLEDSLIRTWSL